MLHICIVTSVHKDYDFRIWRHAISLANVGCSVSLVCPWDAAPRQTWKNLSLRAFKRSDRRIASYFSRNCRILVKLLSDWRKYDLIHFHDPDLLPLMALLSFFKPVVYDVHENYPEEVLVRDRIPKPLRRPLAFAVYWIQVFLSAAVRNIVLVSPGQDRDFTGCRRNLVHVFNYPSIKLTHHAVDDLHRREPIILFPGGLYRENGCLLIVEIAAELKRRGCDARFLLTAMFATQTIKQQLNDAIERFSLRKHIEFIDPVQGCKVHELYNIAVVGILPVLRVPKAKRAVPNKLFEYMAAGVPVVSTDLPFLKGIIEESKCGLLAQPEVAATFADAIEMLLLDRNLAAELGRNGRKAITERYNWESQLPALLDYYRRILQNSCPRGDSASTTRFP